MDRFKNRGVRVILILVGCVSNPFCYCEGYESSLLKSLALEKVLAMTFKKNFLSNFYVIAQFKSISVGMRSICLFSTSLESGRTDAFEIAFSFQERF